MPTARPTARAWRLSPLIVTAWLTACATAPQPVQVIQACPKVPPLELDAPERDFQGMMQSFLSGMLPKLPEPKQP